MLPFDVELGALEYVLLQLLTSLTQVSMSEESTMLTTLQILSKHNGNAVTATSYSAPDRYLTVLQRYNCLVELPAALRQFR